MDVNEIIIAIENLSGDERKEFSKMLNDIGGAGRKMRSVIPNGLKFGEKSPLTYRASRELSSVVKCFLFGHLPKSNEKTKNGVPQSRLAELISLSDDEYQFYCDAYIDVIDVLMKYSNKADGVYKKYKMSANGCYGEWEKI